MRHTKKKQKLSIAVCADNASDRDDKSTYRMADVATMICQCEKGQRRNMEHLINKTKTKNLNKPTEPSIHWDILFHFSFRLSGCLCQCFSIHLRMSYVCVCVPYIGEVDTERESGILRASPSNAKSVSPWCHVHCRWNNNNNNEREIQKSHQYEFNSEIERVLLLLCVFMWVQLRSDV